MVHRWGWTRGDPKKLGRAAFESDGHIPEATVKQAACTAAQSRHGETSRLELRKMGHQGTSRSSQGLRMVESHERHGECHIRTKRYCIRARDTRADVGLKTPACLHARHLAHSRMAVP